MKNKKKFKQWNTFLSFKWIFKFINALKIRKIDKISSFHLNLIKDITNLPIYFTNSKFKFLKYKLIQKMKEVPLFDPSN